MILDQIIADTRALVARRAEETPVEVLQQHASAMPATCSLLDAVRAPGVSLIAEIKRASPSKGVLNLSLDPAGQAAVYVAAGADAISVLTEPAHFGGSLEDLGAARASLKRSGRRCPLLRKDFIIDPYQLYEARAWGADAVLLIVAALDDATLAQLYRRALQLSLTPLIEVHNQSELTRACLLQPALIGINNRNLHDFSVSLDTTRHLREEIPLGVTVISESGIHAPQQMAELAQMGVDGALVGEALVIGNDPAAVIRALKEAGR